MSSSSLVRTAWSNKIWTDLTVIGITDRIFLYDVIADSTFDAAKLYYDQQINFFTCLVQRAHEARIMHSTLYQYLVTVTYYKQQTDVEDSTYNDVQDTIEIVDGLVITSLGTTWDSTVDYYTGSNAKSIDLTTIDGKKCWRGGYTYTAFKTT